MSKHWQQTPAVISGRDSRAHEKFGISADSVMQLLGSSTLAYGQDVDITMYTDDARQTLNGEGMAGAEAVKAVEDGCSARLRCPQAAFPVLAQTLSSLEDYFGTFTASNVYLTPAACAGFAPHWDDVDAFLCQVSGSKNWRVHAPPPHAEHPRHSSDNFSIHDVGEPALEVTLNPGDVLYIPRGWIHHADTPADSDGPSLHVTISTGQRMDWVELLKHWTGSMLEAAALHCPELRRTVPRGWQYTAGLIHDDPADGETECSSDGDGACCSGHATAGHAHDAPATGDLTEAEVAIVAHADAVEYAPAGSSQEGANDARRAARAAMEQLAQHALNLMLEHADGTLGTSVDALARKFMRERIPPPECAAQSGAASSAKLLDEDSAVLLTHPLVARLAKEGLESDELVVYFATRNSLAYMGNEEGRLAVAEELGPAVDMALRAVSEPVPVSVAISLVEELNSIGADEEEEGDASDVSGDVDWAASVLALFQELIDVQVLRVV